jgi:hypothetical protein
MKTLSCTRLPVQPVTGSDTDVNSDTVAQDSDKQSASPGQKGKPTVEEPGVAEPAEPAAEEPGVAESESSSLPVSTFIAPGSG